MKNESNDTSQLSRAERLKIPELKREFKRRLEEFGEESISSEAEELRDPLTGLNEQEFIDLRLNSHREQLPKKPKGRYKDPLRVAIKYRQKFVDYIRVLCPEVIEELRDLVQPFNELFAGRHKDQYQQLIWNLQENLFGPARTVKDFTFQGQPPAFDYEYHWGEYRWLLYTLAGKESTCEIGSNPDPVEIEKIRNSNTESLASARHKIEAAFARSAQANLDVVTAFVDLQCALNEWADRHRVPRDWMIEYGYYFIWQFSNRPNLLVSELQVNALDSRLLEGPTFIFHARGWRAGEESKDDYERGLRKYFESELNLYFDRTARSLSLEKTKKVIKPIKYDNVKWLVRWTVQGWSKRRIRDEVDSAESLDDTTVDKAFATLRSYGLPVPE